MQSGNGGFWQVVLRGALAAGEIAGLKRAGASEAQGKVDHAQSGGEITVFRRCLSAGDLSLDFLATGSTGEDLSLDIRAGLSGVDL